MISLELNQDQVLRLQAAVRSAVKSMSKELASALNDVTKATEVRMGKQIREKVSLKVAIVKKNLTITVKATPNRLQGVVRLGKTKRLGLRHFGAKQDKRGVSYKIEAKGGRSRVDGAFMGPKPGAIRMTWKGNAFKRVGKNRLPIVQIKGVSAWGTFVKNDMTGPTVKEVSDELSKQMERRINLNVLRANGLVKT